MISEFLFTSALHVYLRAYENQNHDKQVIKMTIGALNWDLLKPGFQQEKKKKDKIKVSLSAEQE